MRVTPPQLAAMALLATGLIGAPALAQDNGQGATNAITPPSTQQQPGVLLPKPDLHGRAGSGTGQQHQNDAASPGGSSAGSTGTGMSGAGASTNEGTGANAGNAPLPPQQGGSSQ
jgi:hypothetical protein